MAVKLVMMSCLLVAVGVSSWRQVPLASAAPVTSSSARIMHSLPDEVKGNLSELLSVKGGALGKVTCDVCKIIVGTVQKLYNTHTAWNEIAKIVGEICYHLKIEDEHVCKAIPYEFKVSLNPHVYRQFT